VKIHPTIPAAYCNDAAALYWEAFGAKLGLTLGPKDRALRFITSVLARDHGICAVDDAGALLGVVGFKTVSGALVGGNFQDMRKVYGMLGATWRTAVLATLERDVENECFLMDGLFVAEQARGQGVGTALLDAICAEARKRGYNAVRLDVIDTNTRARSLYDRYGFEVRKTHSIGWLRYIFGFKNVTAMVCKLQ